MNTTTDDTPATDGQIAARLIAEREKAGGMVNGNYITVQAWIGGLNELRWMVADVASFGTGSTVDAAIADFAKAVSIAKRKGEIEARVRAELEATT